MNKKLLVNFLTVFLKNSILPVLITAGACNAQGVHYPADLSPAEGLVKRQEKPFRQEICLNGRWDFQPVAIPANWVADRGNAPQLAEPDAAKWETVKIKIPSPWNINGWGSGSQVGPGTNAPYAPSSVYYPSYPTSWEHARMGWLKRDFTVPPDWRAKSIVLHFEAVAGDCEVYINGQIAHHQFDAYLPFDIDITSLINWTKPNQLLVGIKDRKLFNKKDPRYKYFSATYPAGSNTSNLIGIWQDVFLQALPLVKVESVFAKPLMDKDELKFDVEVKNESPANKNFVVRAKVREWLNLSVPDQGGSPEIKWDLGDVKLDLSSENIVLLPGESRKVTLSVKVAGKLKIWSPSSPNLYTVVLDIGSNGKTIDRKTERFGWRGFTIKGKDFYLNNKKIQCYGDLSHPFGPYICSRRFAWAWFKMIKDAGGNAVRPHAQPWPRLYYDLADEMGILVLNEVALFGSSIQLNFEDENFWQRAADHVDHLVLRDRNHPSVIGWSVGNEMFAIALLNKPSKEIAETWNTRVAALASRPPVIDPTRNFVTLDGDEDLNGRLWVYSKHFGHGLRVLPDVKKPIVIGENGASYYGKPWELFPYVGVKAYGSYYQRNEALAIDLYQNVVKTARLYTSWFSPSEVCWFGIEHLNLGYHDFSRLPDLRNGIFPSKAYQEGKPGYQFERIPPYVTTFNPGLDPDIPLYRPLPMFEAYKAAIAGNGPLPSPWDHFQDTTSYKKPFPAARQYRVKYIGPEQSPVLDLLDTLGIRVNNNDRPDFLIIDGDQLTKQKFAEIQPDILRLKKRGGKILLLMAEQVPAINLNALLPAAIKLTERHTTALRSDSLDEIGRYFDLRDLYFSEMDGDRNIMKKELKGPLLKKTSTAFSASKTDWSLFNGINESAKCAQVILYENLIKTPGTGFIDYKLEDCTFYVSSLDYKIINQRTISFWKLLAAAIELTAKEKAGKGFKNNKKHDLLLDGPVN